MATPTSNPFEVNFTPTPSPVPAQRTAYDTFNTNFTNFLGGQETVPQLQARYENKYNIPYLEDLSTKQNVQLGSLGNQIQAIPQDINSETSQSLLTAGQKARQIESRQAPLISAYNKLGTIAGQTQTNLGTARTNQAAAVSAEQAQQLKMTQPWLQAYDANTIMNAAEMTGWTQTNSMELNRLLTNASNGMAWSNAEANRAQELAMQEKSFEQALKLQKTPSASDIVAAYAK